MKANEHQRTALIALALGLMGVAAVAATAALIDESGPGFWDRNQQHIIAAEVALFSIIVVEFAGKAVLQRFRQAHALQMGIAVRAVLRVVAYLVISISIVSIIAENPALAVGVGAVTGLIIGFSMQNLIGNVFAGMFLAIGRPFRIGDEVTVMGLTGLVREIGLMYTVIEAEDRWIMVPSMSLMTTPLQRKKYGVDTQETETRE